MKYNENVRIKLEEQILSTILGFGKKYLSLDEAYILHDDHFKKDIHKDIMLAIRNTKKAGKSLSIETVPFVFKKKYSIIKKGDEFAIIANIAKNATTSTVLEENILKLKEYSMVDKLETMFFKFDRIDFDNADVLEYLEKATSEIEEIKALTNVNTSYSMSENVSDTLQLIEDNAKKFIKKGIIGVPTGFDNIDSFSGGFLDEELVIIGARPSSGKTTYALNVASNASERGYRPMIFSLETSRTSLMLKIISNRTGVDSKKLFLGKTDENDFAKINGTIGYIENTNLIIEDSTYGLDSIVSKIRFNKAKGLIDIVFIDYLQLIKVARGHSREQEVAHISRTLKMLAKELVMPIVALSQLGRPPKGIMVKRPNLTDLRESGALEQDADTVLFIHRPEMYYDPGEEVPEDEINVTEIIYRKGRNIGTALFKLIFDKGLAKFKERDIF